MRDKLVTWNNELIDKDIKLQREAIRRFKSEGAKESDLRCHYAEITKLELMKL